MRKIKISLGLLSAILVVFLAPSISFGAIFNTNLSYGTKGTDVSQLQQFLIYEGLYNGPVTFTFGPLTLDAVIAFQRQKGITPAVGYFGTLTRYYANTIIATHPEWTTPVSNYTNYRNSLGNSIRPPVFTVPGAVPAGSTAKCRDGSYSSSESSRGTCSHHGGVSNWLN